MWIDIWCYSIWLYFSCFVVMVSTYLCRCTQCSLYYYNTFGNSAFFSNCWSGICARVLNYDTLSTTNSSKIGNHYTKNELETTAYLASKWQHSDLASVLDYSLAWRQNPHSPASGLPIFPGYLSDNYYKYKIS